jgi:protein-S-isoprenylcysteine O-methyltransferase Ste14
LAAGSFTLVFVAIRYLGPQWAVQARTIKGHALVTTGPYGIVRHPIYLGLGGFLVAVGLFFATWWALVAASALYLVGANIRIKAEDALMAAAFGEAFEAYRRRVPALVPRIRAA